MKRKIALAFVGAVLVLAGAGLLALRTRWAGERLCQLAEARVRQATGLHLELSECRVEPFQLQVSAREVRLGPADAPVFVAEAVRARLAPVQAPSRTLELAELELTRPRVTARLPASPEEGGRCPPPALRRFEIHRLQITQGAVDLTFARGERVVIGRVEVRAAPPLPRHGIARLAPAGVRRTGLDVTLGAAHVEAGPRRFDLDEAHLAADLALDLSRLDLHLLSAELPGASLMAAGTVEQLCDPRLDLAASVRGRIPTLLALLGRSGLAADGRLEADVTVTGRPARPEVAGEIRLAGAGIDGWRPGDASAQVRFDGSELRVERLEVPTLGGRVTARGTLRFEGLGREAARRKRPQILLDAEAKLESVELGEILARLKLPGAWVSSRITGTARAAGPVWPLELRGGVALDVADFRALPQGWDRVPQRPAILELPRSHLDAEVTVDPGGVHIDEGRLRAGPGTLVTRGLLHFDSQRGFALAVQGGADLSQLGHIGPVQIGGFADLEGGIVRAAPYGNPHIETRARVRNLEFLDLDLGEASAGFVYDRFVLRVSGVEGRRGATRYQAQASVDLEASPPEVSDGRFAVDGKLRDVFEAAMGWLPSAVHARDALDGAVALRGTASGPASALDASFEGDLGRGALLGREFDGGRLSGRVERGARVAFDAVELRRGRGTARAWGRIGFAPPHPWSLEGSFAEVGLTGLALPGSGWAGTAGGTAKLRGSWEEPSLAFTVHGDEVAVSEASLGAVQLGGTLTGNRLALTGSARGVRATASATLAGRMPFEARADIDEEDLARFRLGGARSALRARARGRATASGVLTDLAAARAELRLDELRGGYGELRVENAEPIVLGLDRRRVVIRSFALRGANTKFALTGGGDVSGALALDARGALDLRLLAGAVPGVTEPRGQLQLEAHVGGTLGQPSLIGTGQLREAGFRIRDLPIVFAGLGGDLAFSQDRMLFDGLKALVNGGRAELSGEVELVRLFPERVRVGATVEAVPVRIPEWLPAVVSGRLQAAGTWDAMLLSGKLHVLRALYTDPVDLEKRLVEVQGKKSVTRPFDRAGAWLSLDLALAVDGDARIENDLVRGSLHGDLTLTGTLASVGLVGTLTMAEGGRGTFRGNEFTLTHAVVDFTDRRKVRMSLDVHGDAQVRDYQVFMHLLGPFENPTLRLTSQPALSQEDIVTLLSLGYTSRDAAGGMSGVATAAAAQALFSASGLDDQIRRFVPRGRLLRDFSFRITSAYSEASGQVEPRAEFETKALDERLRLRYQAPMAGARGQRAQAEMRLFSHTSIQYQWDNENPDLTGGDHGVDLKLRWDWND